MEVDKDGEAEAFSRSLDLQDEELMPSEERPPNTVPVIPSLEEIPEGLRDMPWEELRQELVTALACIGTAQQSRFTVVEVRKAMRRQHYNQNQ